MNKNISRPIELLLEITIAFIILDIINNGIKISTLDILAYIFSIGYVGYNVYIGHKSISKPKPTTFKEYFEGQYNIIKLLIWLTIIVGILGWIVIFWTMNIIVTYSILYWVVNLIIYLPGRTLRLFKWMFTKQSYTDKMHALSHIEKRFNIK